jgi:hypothetical protein
MLYTFFKIDFKIQNYENILFLYSTPCSRGGVWVWSDQRP